MDVASFNVVDLVLIIYNLINNFLEEIEEHVIHEFENFVQHATNCV